MSYHGALEGPNRRAAIPDNYANSFSQILEVRAHFSEGTQLCIHLSIVFQHEYTFIVDSNDVMANAVFYTECVSRNLIAARFASVIVWPHEAPGSLAVHFIKMWLDCHIWQANSVPNLFIKKLVWSCSERFKWSFTAMGASWIGPA